MLAHQITADLFLGGNGVRERSTADNDDGGVSDCRNGVKLCRTGGASHLHSQAVAGQVICFRATRQPPRVT